MILYIVHSVPASSESSVHILVHGFNELVTGLSKSKFGEGYVVWNMMNHYVNLV